MASSGGVGNEATLHAAVAARQRGHTCTCDVGGRCRPRRASGSTKHGGGDPSGATFTLSPGWTQKSSPKLIELTSPEGDYRMALVEVGAAADAGAAAAQAWQLWAPTKARPPKLITARTARNGWEERKVVDYETSPNEKRVLFAVAYRTGPNWTVVLADGAEATGEKRLAAIGLVQQSLRPAGYKRESFAGLTAKPMDAARIAALRSFVEQAMQELGVPGAAIAITDRQRTLYSGGVGVRALGDAATVDGDTSFAIASNTKGMGTLLLAKLVDEGKLDWDQPVTAVYPTFKLGSDATTSKVLVRHLVCACTGLPRKDFQVIFNSDPKAAAKDTFAQLASTEPTSGFGEVFQYNNLMASAAGYVGGHLTYPAMGLDSAFERAVNDKVWKPLGMTRTTLNFATGTRGNWARPHATDITGRPGAHPSERSEAQLRVHSLWRSRRGLVDRQRPRPLRPLRTQRRQARRRQAVCLGQECAAPTCRERACWRRPGLRNGDAGRQ